MFVLVSLVDDFKQFPMYKMLHSNQPDSPFFVNVLTHASPLIKGRVNLRQACGVIMALPGALYQAILCVAADLVAADLDNAFNFG